MRFPDWLVDFGFALGFSILFACYGRGPVTSMPLWALALVLAIVAPMAVRFFADHLERQMRARTAAVLAKLPRRTGSRAVDAISSKKSDDNAQRETSSDAVVGGGGRSAPH